MSTDSLESIYDPEPPLSARRQKIIHQLLPAVLPSKHPDSKFKILSLDTDVSVLPIPAI